MRLLTNQAICKCYHVAVTADYLDKMTSRRASSNMTVQYLRFMENEVQLYIWAFLCKLTWFRNVRPNFFMLQNHLFLPLLVSWPLNVQCLAKSHQLSAILIPIDDFVNFYHLLAYHTALVSSNTEQNFCSVYIRPSREMDKFTGSPHEFLPFLLMLKFIFHHL